MANRNALIRQLVRLGITYGPIAYQGLLKNKGAVQELTRRQMHQRNHRAMAFEHAGQLIDGSVLPVFDGDRDAALGGDKNTEDQLTADNEVEEDALRSLDPNDAPA